jgi:hypothetical protein
VPNWRSTASPAACPIVDGFEVVDIESGESERIAFLIRDAAAGQAFKRAPVQGFRERVQIPFENEPVDHARHRGGQQNQSQHSAHQRERYLFGASFLVRTPPTVTPATTS